jgi:CspA family cold shock protein
MADQGTVKWFDGKKRFGMIARDGGGPDVFVHHSSIIAEGPATTLAQGDRVSFEVVEGPKGLQAKNVVKIA